MNKADFISNQSLGSLTENSYEKWGNPIENRKSLIPYGFRPIDRAIWGIAPKEFIILQGLEKGRKSTVMHNILRSISKREKLENKPTIVVDILESSSGPESVKDALICMGAAEYIMMFGHRSDGYCPVCQAEICAELQLSVRSLPFITKSRLQREAIDVAMQEMSSWNIYLFGPGYTEGRTRDLDSTLDRWAWMQDNLGASLFITDHLQQYYSGRTMTDYEKQQWLIPVLSNFVGERSVTLMALSQLSLTTRATGKDGGRMYATGGAQAAQEANTVLQSIYDEDTPDIVGLQIVESRYSGSLTVYGKIDPASGLIYGDMSLEKPYIERAQTQKEKELAPYGN